jgi:hypothetical protein
MHSGQLKRQMPSSQMRPLEQVRQVLPAMPQALFENPPRHDPLALMQPKQQTPPAQRPGVPTESEHVVLWATGVPSTHTGLPVVQLMTPALQLALGFEPHGLPAEHATHEPFEHTPPGHAVPLPTFPLSVHTGLPVEHDVVPVLQGLAGVQPAPALHGLHVPERHTPPGQPVPLALFEPLAQTPLPELQSMKPF